MASSTKSENVLAEKFDVCVADTLIKMGNSKSNDACNFFYGK